MTRSPQAVSSAAVRRHLEAAGPTVAQVLEAVTTEGAPPVGIQPLVDHVEQTKRWALESGSRHAAWLLYMAARSCLAQVPEYAADTEFVGDPVEVPTDWHERYAVLWRRMTGVGGRLPPWVFGNATRAPAQLAQECVDLAVAIDAEWPWLDFQRGCLAMAKHQWLDAIPWLERATARTLDQHLKVESLRNLIDCALEVGQLLEHRHAVEAFASISDQPRQAASFQMSLYAALSDEAAFREACEQFVTSPDERGVNYWRHVVDRNLGDWASGTKADPQSLRAQLTGVVS